MFINIQLFAHKKGGGSTKNGRVRRLNVSALSAQTDSSFSQATFSFAREERRFIPAKTSASAATTLCSL